MTIILPLLFYFVIAENEEVFGRERESQQDAIGCENNSVVCFAGLSSKELESYKELSLSPGP